MSNNNQNSNNKLVKDDNSDKRPSRGRGGRHNFPNAQYDDTDKDLIKQVIYNNLHWYKLGIKEKCQNDDEIEQRTIYFFEYCLDNGERPTVEKYCLALGYSRNTVLEWENGHNNASKRRMSIIKNAKECISAYDADMVIQGKLNPVPYIFRAKNYYGMRDQQDIVVQPKQSITDDIDADAIAVKYAELPDD